VSSMLWDRVAAQSARAVVVVMRGGLQGMASGHRCRIGARAWSHRHSRTVAGDHPVQSDATLTGILVANNHNACYTPGARHRRRSGPSSGSRTAPSGRTTPGGPYGPRHGPPTYPRDRRRPGPCWPRCWPTRATGCHCPPRRT
jgi:hypothetical protein